jgi:hypothetical protein
MKSLFFTICIIAAFAFTANAQKMAAQLQSKKWHANGTIGKGTPVTLRTTQGKAPADWDATFDSNGTMSACSTLKKSIIDISGMEQKAGTYYCDPSYIYKVQNDVIQIQYMADYYYYKLKALANSEGIELVPASKDDFK